MNQKTYELPNILNVKKEQLLKIVMSFLNDYENIFNVNLMTPESFIRMMKDILNYDNDQVFYSQHRFGLQNLVTYNVTYTADNIISVSGESSSIQFPVIRVHRIWVNNEYKDAFPDERTFCIVDNTILKNICSLFLIKDHNVINEENGKITEKSILERYLDGDHLKAIEKFTCVVELLNICESQKKIEKLSGQD